VDHFESWPETHDHYQYTHSVGFSGARGTA
jgi:hypothetical protein